MRVESCGGGLFVSSDPAHKHFEAVSDRMSILLQTPALLGPDVDGKTEAEKLELAYSTAIRMSPEIQSLVAAEQQAAERARGLVDKAKNAAVQINGAPSSAPVGKIDPSDRRAIIANALRAG